MPLVRPACLNACRVGVERSKVEVQFRDLQVQAEVLLGDSGLPTVTTSFQNLAEVLSPYELSAMSLPFNASDQSNFSPAVVGQAGWAQGQRETPTQHSQGGLRSAQAGELIMLPC